MKDTLCPFCHEPHPHPLPKYQGVEGCALCLADLASDWRKACESVEYGHALPDRLKALREKIYLEKLERLG